MKLELTLSKKIIRNKFNIEDKYNNTRTRISNHTLVVSDELLKLWEEEAYENKYQEQFQNWYFSIVGMAKKVKRVKMEGNRSKEDGQDVEDYILCDTAKKSKDHILVGEIENRVKKHFKEVYFVNSTIFNKEKSHTITIDTIRDVWEKVNVEHIFDIYETPIRIDVQMNGDADVLARHLANFYKNSKTITIKDTYIHQKSNEDNLENYVLKFINKNNTKIIFRGFWNYKLREYLTEKFTNYKGYKSEMIIDNKKLSHESYIESDQYIIDLGYRLRVFGDNVDGRTEAEIIMITRK